MRGAVVTRRRRGTRRGSGKIFTAPRSETNRRRAAIASKSGRGSSSRQIFHAVEIIDFADSNMSATIRLDQSERLIELVR